MRFAKSIPISSTRVFAREIGTFRAAHFLARGLNGHGRITRLMEKITMSQDAMSLSERIIMVARLAVEEHLLQSVVEEMSGEGQVTVGGADHDWVTDDSMPLARGRAIYFGDARLAEGEAA